MLEFGSNSHGEALNKNSRPCSLSPQQIETLTTALNPQETASDSSKARRPLQRRQTCGCWILLFSKPSPKAFVRVLARGSRAPWCIGVSLQRGVSSILTCWSGLRRDWGETSRMCWFGVAGLRRCDESSCRNDRE